MRPYRDEDFDWLCRMYWQFYWSANRVDLGEWIEVDFGDQKMRMPKVEAILHWYFASGHKALIAEADGDGIVGFVLYQMPFDCIMMVRGFYLRPDYRGQGLIRKFYQTLGKPLSRIVFQTSKQIPPDRLLEMTAGRRELIGEDDKLLTWEMEWTNG